MRRSKLEMCLDILKVLATRGQLKLTHIMYKSNLNCKVLKEKLDFMVSNQLIEERILKKQKIVYAITPRGRQILRAFTEIKQIFPVEDEEKAPLLY